MKYITNKQYVTKKELIEYRKVCLSKNREYTNEVVGFLIQKYKLNNNKGRIELYNGLIDRDDNIEPIWTVDDLNELNIEIVER